MRKLFITLSLIIISIVASGQGSNKYRYPMKFYGGIYVGGNYNTDTPTSLLPITSIIVDGDSVHFYSGSDLLKIRGAGMTYPAGSGIPVVNGGTTWGSTIANNSTNWNTAYGWGNHASAGYYTGTSSTIRSLFSSTIPAITYNNSTGQWTLTSGYDIPSTSSISNWNTAYSWGNHAGLYDPVNTASGLIGTHNATYVHGNIANGQTAFGWGNHTSAGYFVGTNSTIRGLLSSTLPGITYTNTTGVFSATAGYAIPTTAAFNSKMDTTLFNTRYQSNYDTAFAAADLTYAVVDSNKYGEAITRTYFETKLTDSLTVLRNQINSLITTMNNSGLLVTSINVLGTGGATTIAVDDGTLQMLANVEPNTAIDTTITWSRINGTGTANISVAGLLTALTNGTVTARATANDGSGIYGEEEITISNQLAIGPEKVSNGGFSSSTGWGLDGGWSISADSARFDDVTAGYLQQSGVNMQSNVEASHTYRVTFTLISAGTAQLRFTNFVTGVIYKDYATYGNGSNTFDVTLPESIGTGGFAIRATTASTAAFKIDNFSIKELL